LLILAGSFLGVWESGECHFHESTICVAALAWITALHEHDVVDESLSPKSALDICLPIVVICLRIATPEAKSFCGIVKDVEIDRSPDEM